MRIYLDNAATSWPKPETVYAVIDGYMRQNGAPAGRAAYREAAEAERLVAAARRQVASLLGAHDWRRIAFTANGTDSLNAALQGVLRPGDHVVTSVAEHNSTLRPLRYLRDSRQITVSSIGCGSEGVIDPEDVRRAIAPQTRLIALVHASNVTGAVQPIQAVAEIARQHDLLFLVDAAQSLGHLPFEVTKIHADLVAAPGHKGLLGPLGTGVLYVGPRAEASIEPYRQGGAGVLSHEERQPRELPERLEAGNLNVPGIVGLGAGVEYLRRRTVAELRAHEVALIDRALSRLASMPGIELYGPKKSADRVGVVSLKIAGFSPQEAAAVLDATWGIQARAGLHCAPLMHRSLGTIAADGRSGGTLRLSFGAFTTSDDVDAACDAIEQMAQAG
jgi:cysteine desulfurase family protein